ncbi:MAG: MFS transporter [Sulfolobaceae archaeon]|nr:MFS transporter [Sulfolobaceae archaeon]
MNRRSLVTFIVVLGTMMGAIDSTIVILALPTIVQALHSNLFTIIWVILIYLLIAAVLTTQLGRLGDSYGRSKMYNLGFVIFTIGSALCGAAPTDIFLISSRAVQAVGASLMQANSGAIIADYYPPNERGKAYGYTSVGWNIGAILGIVLGGIITTFIGWRYIFYINVPIGIVAVAFGIRYVKDVNVIKRKFDIAGTIILGILLTLVTYGASDIAGEGVKPFNLTLITLGLLMIIPFIIVERRSEAPIINLKVFRNRVLTSSLLASFFQSSGYLATAFMIIMYLQGIRGLSPFNASLLLVPGYVVASSLSPFVGRLADKIGARIPATIGVAMMMIAAFLYSRLGLNTSLDYIILVSVIGGLGSSMFYPANNSAVMANSPKEMYGAVSGMLRTLGNIGIVLSYTLAIAISASVIPRYVAFEVFLGTSNLIGGLSKAFLNGIHAAFLTSVGILFVAMVLSAIRGKEARQLMAQLDPKQQSSK